ncbi:helix-turn-helix protein [Arcticibacter pallidicorallinus]|uniref:Helix-turn-helix protein n=1 Tax=Arcticibacter pallidicorallinus TaxID=1259464 RepID=A0A2T0U0S2_9SPHI|nr:helix-turn-helix domain-containing protein [Arcticibacter pallidicorallinus]PRY51493.1 helix-turn-helix protein [Arcticibacter pallidicorallinus]
MDDFRSQLRSKRRGAELTQEELGKLVGVSKAAISQFEKGTISPQPEVLHKLEETLDTKFTLTEKLNDHTLQSKAEGDYIPMYNAPAAASGVEIYNDTQSGKVIGYMSFPGITKGSFALPVYGNSMNPTLVNGCWTVLRPIENKNAIIWGEVYYIEWENYRMYKRLLLADNEDEVILWSDNQEEKINGRPIHSPILIKKVEIFKLCLVTDIYKKPNH